MAVQIEDAAAPRFLGHALSVLALVQEFSGFLAAFEIRLEDEAFVGSVDPVGNRAAK